MTTAAYFEYPTPIQMDKDSLTEILSGHHLNMPERVARGIWPHPPLRFGDLVRHLAEIVSSQQWFPAPFVAATPGEFVADVTAIERRGQSEYFVHAQRSGPTGMTIAASGSSRFSSPEHAAAEFLRVEFHLPGKLDGWIVTE